MRRLAGTVGATLRARTRQLAAFALVGLLAGLGWSLSAEPDHSATATVLIGPAAGTDLGLIDPGAADAAERLAELVGGREVSLEAAAELDDDLAGADLLALTRARASSEGVVAIRSTAERPELAIAAANAFARATVEVVATRQRRTLRRADEELRARLDELDPAAEEAAELNGELALVAEALAGPDPVLLGRNADRAAATGERPVAGAAGAGLLGGLIAGTVLMAGTGLRRRTLYAPAQAEGILGPGEQLLASRDLRPAVRSPSPGSLGLDRDDGDRARSLVAALGLADGEPGAALAVTSPMPGDGRTSTALAIASAAAADGLRVLLMEADLRNPGLAQRLRIPEGYGLSDYLVGDAAPREVMRTIPLRSAAPSDEPPLLVCVPAGRAQAPPAELLAGGRFSRLVERVRRVYDLVVFDSPALLPTTEGAATAAAVGSSLLVLRAGVSTENDLTRSRRLLDQAGLRAVVLIDPATGAPDRRIRLTRPRSFSSG